MPPPPPAPAPVAAAPVPAPIQAQGTGIRIPPLNPEKLTQYANLYEQSAGGGYLSGELRVVIRTSSMRLPNISRRTSKGHLRKSGLAQRDPRTHLAIGRP